MVLLVYYYDGTAQLTRNHFIELSSTTIDSVEQLTSLSASRVLKFHDANLDCLTNEQLAGFSFLEVFIAAKNGISKLEDHAFDSCPLLSTLNLSNNLLVALNGSQSNRFANLRHLNLNNNQFNAIGDSIGSLVNLTTLNLRNNRISSLEPNVFNRMADLEELDLSHNRICTIDSDSFRGLFNLKKLALAGNRIEAIQSDWFADMSTLNELDLDKNLIASIDESSFVGLSQLTTLRLRFNRISSLDNHIFKNVPAVEYLELGGNPIGRIRCQALSGIKRVKQIDLQLIEVSWPKKIGLKMRNMFKKRRLLLTLY